ncbi:MAG: NAD-dependent epimerase/dehydratase family protein [Actinomycetota bacterium]
MRLLVLGGTGFVGRAFVEAALGAGHEVTLFNRGQRDPGAFPGAEHVTGDRERDLSPLDGRTWDAVFDASCYVPRIARLSARTLAGRVGVYGFVSSLSVYSGERTSDQDESAPVGTIEDPANEVIDERTYGPLKVLAEREVQEVFGDEALIERPGFIVGPHDTIDRMPWWLRRVARGGTVAAPSSPDYPLQLIDARDIGVWTLAMIEAGRGGVFNLCGPERPLRYGELLETIKRVTRSDAEFVWLPESFLAEEGVDPNEEPFPYWLGPASESAPTFSNRRALDAGLTFHPLEQTIRDEVAWDAARPQEPLDRGIDADRERALLDRWRDRSG